MVAVRLVLAVSSLRTSRQMSWTNDSLAAALRRISDTWDSSSAMEALAVARSSRARLPEEL